MNVAPQELCEQLSELSDWRETKGFAAKVWTRNGVGDWVLETAYHGVHPGQIQAYDLGYMMRKLKSYGYDRVNLIMGGDRSTVGVTSPTLAIAESGDTPEEAAVILAIELFKRGIIKKS